MGIFSKLFGKKNNADQMTEFQSREEYSNRNRDKFTIYKGPKRLVSTTELPSQYNDIPLSGTQIVDGKFCRTVGELKEATEAFYRNK